MLGKSSIKESINTIIDSWAKKEPSTPAILFNDYTITYQLLLQTANRLAWHLIELGLKPEDFVVINLPRTPQLIIAILAVIKCGATYVPCDLNIPQARLQKIIADCQPNFIIGRKIIENGSTIISLNLDKIWTQLTHYPTKSPDIKVVDNHPLYLLYTSGSTGIPKGVLVSQQNVLIRLQGRQKLVFLTSEERVLHRTNISFDPAVGEILWTLMSGATLVIPEEEDTQDINDLIAIIDRHKVNMVDFSPALLATCLQQLKPHNWSSVRTVFCGGDVMSPELVRQFFDKVDASLYNLYGPTETTIEATYHQCQANCNYQTIPIGKPLNNTTIHILNRNLQPVEPGEKGELYIGGEGVAIGYFNDPQLTATCFIKDRFAVSETARLYKTGDLVRLNENEELEFIGRKDFQVKIRGFRVELGDVENSLRQFPNIDDAIVTAIEINKNIQLVGYIQSQQPVDRKELRNFLATQLPYYAVPSFWVFLKEFPLNVNGKINRQALPTVSITDLNSSQLKPQTPLQQQLGQCWQKIFNLEIGIENNFFDLGGHSLNAMQLAIVISEELKYRITVAEIFQYPTISLMAAYLETKQDQLQLSALSKTEITYPTSAQKLPLTDMQLMFWLYYWETKDTWNLITVRRIEGEVDRVKLTCAFNTVLAQQDSFWLSFSSKIPMQRVTKPQVGDIIYYDLACATETSLTDIYERHAYAIFDLKSPPLIKVILVKLRSQEYQLIICAPHIATDDRGLNIFLDCLLNSYLENSNGNRPINFYLFYEYLLRQRQSLTTAKLREEERFWQQYLAGAKFIALPVSCFRSPNPKYFSSTIPQQQIPSPIVLPKELSQTITILSSRYQVTSQTIFTTVLVAALHCLRGQNDISINIGFDCRVREREQSLFASLAKIMPIRIQIPSQYNFVELLKLVKEQFLQLYPHLNGYSIIPQSVLYRSRWNTWGRIFLSLFYCFSPLISLIWLPAKLPRKLFGWFFTTDYPPRWSYRRPQTNQSEEMLRDVDVILNFLQPTSFDSAKLFNSKLNKVEEVIDFELTTPPAIKSDKSWEARSLIFYIFQQQGRYYFMPWGANLEQVAYTKIKKNFINIIEQVITNNK